MAPLFSSRDDQRLRLAVVIAILLAVLAAGTAYALARAGSTWNIGRAVAQPIPFSHAIHAGTLGLDCRFCHAGATQHPDAGMPTGQVCLGCHAQVWSVTAQFTPVTEAVASDGVTRWSSVHRLPDHVRFHHGAHAAAGIACSSCHGAVATMPRTVKAEPLSMGWCLDCHRDPKARGASTVAPGTQVFSHAGAQIHVLTRCVTCHK